MLDKRSNVIIVMEVHFFLFFKYKMMYVYAHPNTEHKALIPVMAIDLFKSILSVCALHGNSTQ